MPVSPGFKQCAACKKPMPTSDPHEACLKCLGESHRSDKCRICKAFKPRTKKERDQRLRTLLMEAALDPSTSQTVVSAPAPDRSGTEKTPRHRPSPAPESEPRPSKSNTPARQTRLERPASTSAAAPPAPSAPLTPGPAGPLSPVPPSSPMRSGVEIVVPSTPETFASARDLIALTEPTRLPPPVPPVRVVSRGKPMLSAPPRDSRSPSRSRRLGRSRSRRRSQSRHRSPQRYRSHSRQRSASRRSRSGSSRRHRHRDSRSRSRRYSPHRSTSRHRAGGRSRSRSRSRSTSRHRAGGRSRSTSRHRAGGRSRHRSGARHRDRSRSRSRSRHRYDSRHRSPAPRRSSVPARADPYHPGSAPPWPSRQPSVSSQTDSGYALGTDRQAALFADPPLQDQGPQQWGFWTPWAYHQAQGPQQLPARPATAERRAPEASLSRPPPSPEGDEGSKQQDSAVAPETEARAEEDPQLDTIVPGVSSSSSPDEAVAGTSSNSPPPLDLRAHQDLLRRLAQNLSLQAEEVSEIEDPIVTILSSDAPTRVALPFIRTIQANANTIWQSPASIPPTAKGVERKYMAPSKGYEYLHVHPTPGSLVVQSVNDRERHGQEAPAPKSREARRMDILGRKVYSAGALQLRVSNQQALLSRYAFNSWVAVDKFKELLPQDARQEFTAILDEGKKVARTALQASLDAADSAARTLASGVTMRRISWLQVSGLPPELQHTIQDLPFEGQGLFSDKTDPRLKSLKDNRVIARSLGMHTPVTQRRPFRPQQQQHRRPFSQFRQRQDLYRRRGRNGRRRQSGNQGGQNQGSSKPPPGPKPSF
ncbi:serine/arginine repetitive matrix protein 2-like isoform X2 [Gopherus flavomarginatus]|uniref:serine/arginine repetitive matrix protein 2-like isoform X2 n=1 Tax=Gopherus flavomarginatus TaxID=286002 RepID=UPI0021CBFD4A|nr:serine/arginine repetitive matrix protein 2-like isoform X2 [Gopherus flavomarginatus]